MRAPTAALVVVGSEVLSAKVADENGPWLARRLRELGVELRAIATVADRVDDIVEAVDRERRRAGWLFTSGGVGPTHDDLTVAAVARALGRPLARHAQLALAIDALHRRHHGGEAAPEAALRMADVPVGTELVGDQGYPTLVCGNVVLLPGVPRFFRYQFDRVATLLAGAPFRLAQVYLVVREERIAGSLAEVALAHPGVELGSYPQFDDGDHLVRLTVESRDLPAVEAALRALLGALPAGAVLRVEGP
ncbi:MAG: competence/damage-inducible protein A [Anaeromyxobacter sp.]|nr:competence/damage-inducible protein A [Anaeromyxobacter sp.]MBL0277970.1 competence/damage-inducible protein A [Anaeromyxobacter sp.]